MCRQQILPSYFLNTKLEKARAEAEAMFLRTQSTYDKGNLPQNQLPNMWAEWRSKPCPV